MGNLLLNTKMPKYSGRRRKTTYVPKVRTRTVRKPYGNRYGNDAFVKVEYLIDLGTAPGVPNDVYTTMRVDENGPLSTTGNAWLVNREEHRSFASIYARYEVVGMKMEVTLSPQLIWINANMAGGLSTGLANPAPFPSEDANNSFPL